MMSENKNTILAALLALSRPASAAELSRALDCDAGSCEKEIRELMSELREEDGAFIIRQIEDKYALSSNEKYFDRLVRIVSTPKKAELSNVLMETLAIIAGQGCATRVDIEKIRGVKSDFAVNKLVEYGLVEERGRLNVPGKPIVFAPTEEFYKRFGVEGSLPQISDEEELRLRGEVRSELNDIDEPEEVGV